MSIARGEYVGFLDSDDSMNLTVLRKILDTAERSTSEIIAFNGIMTDDSGVPIDSNLAWNGIVPNRKQYVRSCAELWLQFVRRDYLIKQGGLFLTAGVCLGEDLATVLPLFVRARSVQFIDAELYHYRRQDNSVIHRTDARQRLTILNAFQHIFDVLNCDELNRYHDEIEWQAVNHILNYEVRAQLRFGLRGWRYAHNLLNWVEKRFPNWKDNPYVRSEIRKQGMPCRLALQQHYLLIMLYQSSRTCLKRLSAQFRHVLCLRRSGFK